MYKKKIICLLMAVVMLAGCGSQNEDKSPFTDEKVLGVVASEQDVIAEESALPDILQPEASGTAVEENDRAVIDYSNLEDGYVMVQFKDATDKRLKVQVKGPTTTYKYDISVGSWETFPLSDGNGTYQIAVYENVEGSKYAAVLSATAEVTLKDEFAPFIRPNQYVNYGDATETIKLAAKLTQGKETELEKVQAVYEYVVNNITYDTELAATVKSGYLPVLDKVLETKKGICFDYAALMTGMLRSQSVPCKLVVGYAGEVYHAWISVYSEKDGWIDSAIYFDGTSWKRLDPTFAASSNRSEAIMEYIGDGSNYTVNKIY